MSNKFRMLELDDGFVGSLDDISLHTNVDVSYINKMMKRKKKIGNYDYKDLGFFVKKKVYRLTYNGDVVFEGTAEGIEEEFGYVKSSVSKALKRGMLGKYTIRYIKDIIEKAPEE